MRDFRDQDIIVSLERLLHELPELLDDQEAKSLGGDIRCWLKIARDPERRSQAVTFAMETAVQNRRTRDRLRQLLTELTGVEAETFLAGFEPEPGGPQQPIPLGSPVVCPNDRTHWRDDLRVTGERCPVCNALLVPDTDDD